jgi:hypothetical protein
MPRGLPKKAAAQLPRLTAEDEGLDAQLKSFIQQRIGDEIPEILESLLEQAKGIWVEVQRPDGTVGRVYKKEPSFNAAALLLNYKLPPPKAVQQMEVSKTVTYEDRLASIKARKVGESKLPPPVIVAEPIVNRPGEPLALIGPGDDAKNAFRARFNR